MIWIYLQSDVILDLKKQRDKSKLAGGVIVLKKLTALVLAVVCALGLAGCQKATKSSEVYSFPEPTTLITGTFYSQGQETTFEIGSENYDPND